MNCKDSLAEEKNRCNLSTLWIGNLDDTQNTFVNLNSFVCVDSRKNSEEFWPIFQYNLLHINQLSRRSAVHLLSKSFDSSIGSLEIQFWHFLNVQNLQCSFSFTKLLLPFLPPLALKLIRVLCWKSGCTLGKHDSSRHWSIDEAIQSDTTKTDRKLLKKS